MLSQLGSNYSICKSLIYFHDIFSVEALNLPAGVPGADITNFIPLAVKKQGNATIF